MGAYLQAADRREYEEAALLCQGKLGECQFTSIYASGVDMSLDRCSLRGQASYSIESARSASRSELLVSHLS